MIKNFTGEYLENLAFIFTKLMNTSAVQLHHILNILILNIFNILILHPSEMDTKNVRNVKNLALVRNENVQI